MIQINESTKPSDVVEVGKKKAKMTINNPTIIIRNTTPEKVLWTPHHLFYLESA